MTKNVTVLDSEGMIIGKTYPKRAAGLVKNGRARYCIGPEPAIILSRSPDIETSEEDEIMSTYNSDELRERIDSMLREAREKLDSVCKTAADTIDEFVSKIDDAGGSVHGEDAAEPETETEPETATETETEGDPKPRVRFVRLSDEDMAKIRERMADMRESFCRAAEEAKNIAARAGAEIGRYAEGVRARVSEKLAEREAESAAKTDSVTPGTEAYYLRRIEEIGRDTAHFTAMESAVREYVTNSASENDTMSDAVVALAGTVREHELTNRRLLEFYIGMLEAKQHEHE